MSAVVLKDSTVIPLTVLHVAACCDSDGIPVGLDLLETLHDDS